MRDSDHADGWIRPSRGGRATWEIPSRARFAHPSSSPSENAASTPASARQVPRLTARARRRWARVNPSAASCARATCGRCCLGYRVRPPRSLAGGAWVRLRPQHLAAGSAEPRGRTACASWGCQRGRRRGPRTRLSSAGPLARHREQLWVGRSLVGPPAAGGVAACLGGTQWHGYRTRLRWSGPRARLREQRSHRPPVAPPAARGRAACAARA